MFTYKTLENTRIQILNEAFVNAFSDYEIKIDLPLWKFQQLLQRRNYVPELSIGAFRNESLVGFVLNGFRNCNGTPTAYDTGTGVIGEYRKQGITSNMMLHIRKLLIEKEVKQYLLEVLQSNTPAIELYQKQGFEIIRNLVCLQLDKNKYKPMTNFEVEHVEKINLNDWKQLTSFWDWIPSWQNSIDSINAVADTFIYSIVRIDDAIVGYGIIDKKTGDIPQIAVNKHYRRKGIARSLLTNLIGSTESDKISFINVDDQSTSTKVFLLNSGFESVVSQYEMILSNI